MTGTPSLRSCPIKPEESPPRRWKSTSATCGRRSFISFVASAVVAAGPVTLAPKSSRCCFRASATLWESSTRRISNPRRSSSDPLSSGGPQFLEEDIASYSIGRHRSASTSSIACSQSTVSRWGRAPPTVSPALDPRSCEPASHPSRFKKFNELCPKPTPRSMRSLDSSLWDDF